MIRKKHNPIVFGEWDLWNVSQRSKTNAEFWEWVDASHKAGFLPELYTDEFINNWLRENDSTIANRRYEFEEYERSLSNSTTFGLPANEMGAGRSGVISLDPAVHEQFIESMRVKHPIYEEDKPDKNALHKANILLRETSKRLGWITTDEMEYFQPILGLFIMTRKYQRKWRTGPFSPSLIVELFAATGIGKATESVCMSGMAQPEFKFFRADNIAAIMMSSVYDESFIRHISRYAKDYQRRLSQWQESYK